MAVVDYVYFDMYQADPKNEPPAPGIKWSAYVPLIKTYSFEPIDTVL